MDFFGRVTELEKLDSEYRRDSASFVLLHCCPRVGKTSLIRKFVEHKKYFMAQTRSDHYLKSVEA